MPLRNPNLESPCRILAIGRDIMHIGGSANVLTYAGYTVDVVLRPEHAARRASLPRYELAIICCNFSYDEQLAIRARLRQVRPNLPVLLMKPEFSRPETLLSVVEAAIQAGEGVSTTIAPSAAQHSSTIKS